MGPRAEVGPVATGALEAAVAAAILGYGVLVHRAIPEAWHVPANLAAAGAVVLAARGRGASLDDLGLAPDRLGAGLRSGALVALPIAGAIGAGLTLPATRRYFLDERVTRGSRRRLLYEVGVRIPAGTALAEELLFRSGLLGLLGLRHPAPVAVAASSAAFGLWHVVPTLDSLATHPVAAAQAQGRPGRSAAAVAGTVALTAAAGAGFAVLRLRSRSIAAPIVVHAALNGLAFAGGWLAARRTGRVVGDPARREGTVLAAD